MEFTETLSLSKIGKHAFEQAKIKVKQSDTNMHLLSTTPYVVDEYAFYKCEGISSNVRLILKNITSIGAHAFEGIPSDTWGTKARLDIRLSEGDLRTLTYLGENAFYDTNVSTWGNETKGYHAYVDLINSELTTIPDGAFYYTWITDLKIGPTITTIGNGAFKRCVALTKVELKDGLLTIEDEAFSGCSALTAISIPASVTMMGNDIFTGCADTFVVTVEAGSYGEVWARTCGYAYVVNGQVEDTSWLN